MRNVSAEDEKKRKSSSKRRRATELKEINMEKITIDRKIVECSLNAVNEYRDAVCPEETKHAPLAFKVKEYLTLDEAIAFVESATEAYFPQGNYSPIVGDIATAILTVETYTNLELPEDISEKYAVISAECLIPTIEINVNLNQYNNLVSNIRASVEERKRIAERDIEKELDKISLLFENIANSTQDIMNGFDIKDVKALLSASSDGKIDEEKLVKAYSKVMLDKSDETVDVN